MRIPKTKVCSERAFSVSRNICSKIQTHQKFGTTRKTLNWLCVFLSYFPKKQKPLSTSEQRQKTFNLAGLKFKKIIISISESEFLTHLCTINFYSFQKSSKLVKFETTRIISFTRDKEIIGACYSQRK